MSLLGIAYGDSDDSDQDSSNGKDKKESMLPGSDDDSDDEPMALLTAHVHSNPAPTEHKTQHDGLLSPAEESLLKLKSAQWGLRLIPPLLEAKLSVQVEERIRICLDSTAKGERFTDNLQSNQEFHNPCFFDTIFQRYQIDPLGSNLDPEWGGGMITTEDEIWFANLPTNNYARAQAQEECGPRASVPCVAEARPEKVFSVSQTVPVARPNPPSGLPRPSSLAPSNSKRNSPGLKNLQLTSAKAKATADGATLV